MSDKNIIKPQSLSSISIFSTLTSDHQQRIISKTTHLSIKAGQTLIKEGEEANALFFLLQGRLIVYAGKKPIAEISPGEPVGEIAFLTGEYRTATVVASRNCKLLQLDQQAYNSLIRDIPELTQSIIRVLARRVISNNTTSAALEPKASNVIALLPAGESAISDDFIKQLLSIKNKISACWKILYASELHNTGQLTEWIESNEEQSCQLILIASGSPEQSEVTLAMAEHADKSFLILDTTLNNSASVSALEKTVYEASLLNNVDLVILRKDITVKITGTSKLLSARQAHLHHHVALNHKLDFERLQRFIAGKAIGLVLSGGGAFGSAHLGMIKALQEQGYVFDMIGGTSIGSIMSAYHALGHTPDEALKKVEEVFLNKKALGKYSIPFYSFVDHKNCDHELKEGTENIDIEDMPINYFAVATNLSRNKLHIIRKGPLWQALRSSCSLPGILPPFITQDGEVLIDGALMDNVPIEILRAMKPGPNMVMDFAPPSTWKVNSSYEKIPRGWALLKQIMFPKRNPRKDYPTIFTILAKTMVTNAELRYAEIDQKNDIFLESKMLPDMGALSWEKLREQFDLAYKQMSSAILQAESVTKKDRFQVLREAAQYMKRE